MKQRGEIIGVAASLALHGMIVAGLTQWSLSGGVEEPAAVAPRRGTGPHLRWVARRPPEAAPVREARLAPVVPREVPPPRAEPAPAVSSPLRMRRTHSPEALPPPPLPPFPRVPPADPFPQPRTARAPALPPAEMTPASPPPQVGSGAPPLTAAALTSPLRPIYPRECRRRGHEGGVLLRLHVSERGRILDVKILEGSGCERLDRAAVETARGLRLRPARRGGEAVPSHLDLPLRYSLQAR